MYGPSSEIENRPPDQRPRGTAGLRWQPDICPIANAMVNTVKPNAKETPSNPMPTFEKEAARTALPQPPNTSQNVPINSAPNFFDNSTINTPLFLLKTQIILLHKDF